MKKIETRTIINIALAVFALYLGIQYWSNISGVFAKILGAATPLILGFVIAYPLNILMSFFERHYFPRSQKKAVLKTRTPVSLLLAIISLTVFVAVILVLIIPQLVSCIKLLITQIPSFIESLILFLEKHEINSSAILDKLASVDWQTRISQLVEKVISGFGDIFDVVVSTVSTVVSGVTAVVIALIFAVYLLLSKKKLTAQANRVMTRFLKPDIYTKIKHISDVLNDSFHRFIVGQCTEAIILGGLCTLGMFILRLPYAPMIGAVIGFSALIPVVGAFIGGGIGAFLILTESPTKALIFLIFLIILQQIEGNIIYPKVVGSSMGLPAIWVLVAVVVGGGVFGIPGMIIGVPLVGAIYKLAKEYLNTPPKNKIPETPEITETKE